VARRLHGTVRFDLAAHVTFVKYWAPSAVAGLDIPFVWGPVGGGESAPRPFYARFSESGLRYERRRDFARTLMEKDPRVRRTARRATLTFATTDETRLRAEAIGARRVEVRSGIGLSAEEAIRFASVPRAPEGPPHFLAMGRLLAFKGFRFALEAFARAANDASAAGDGAMAGARLTILGDGPERPELEQLVRDLGIADRVSMPGHVARDHIVERLAASHALIHPSLHESGGGVCLEAMAAGRPVVCFDLGGSSVHVAREAGVRVPAPAPEPGIAGLAAAIRMLAGDPAVGVRMGAAGRAHVRRHFIWEDRIADLAERYREIAATPAMAPTSVTAPAVLARIDA
jgi:glycosyltransferase involved in cell wall biosynthesis